MSFKNTHLKTILFHGIFWIAVWFLYYYFFNYNSTNQAYVIWFSSLLLPLTMAVTYLAILYLIPKFLLQKSYLKFALYSFYTIVASSYIIVLIIYGCLILLKSQISTIPPMVKNFFFILILVYLVVFIISFINILNQNFKAEQQNKDLQNKILSASLQLKEQELHYLKRQIHPHFLFNTLNTIYGLSLNKSKQTPEVILMLSNLLDYLLYQIDKPLVKLSDEIEHIKEYIELEKIRFQETLLIDINTSIKESNFSIAPMLLIPFVENAFKHGALVNGSLSISMNIQEEENKMKFCIENSINPDEPQHTKKGIGIENIEKRLDLNYKGHYSLSHEINDKRYKVELSLTNPKIKT